MLVSSGKAEQLDSDLLWLFDRYGRLGWCNVRR